MCIGVEEGAEHGVAKHLRKVSTRQEVSLPVRKQRLEGFSSAEILSASLEIHGSFRSPGLSQREAKRKMPEHLRQFGDSRV